MKKIVIVILVLFITFTLVACDENEYDAPPQATESPTTHQENIEQTISTDSANEDEIDYSYYLSPRTAVTGILADSERAFAEISVAVNLGWDSEFESLIWEERTVDFEYAQMIHQILSTMDATEVLTPTHVESQQADTMFRITIQYDDGSVETVYSVWGAGTFYRYTGTYGPHNDPGYVVGMSEDLLAFLTDYF